MCGYLFFVGVYFQIPYSYHKLILCDNYHFWRNLLKCDTENLYNTIVVSCGYVMVTFHCLQTHMKLYSLLFFSNHKAIILPTCECPIVTLSPVISSITK